MQIELGSDTGTGLERLGRHKYDAVIIDCDDLEGGIDLLHDLRKTASNSKSVAFAVLSGKTTTAEAFQYGANFVLQKPLSALHARRCFHAAMDFMMRERRRYFRCSVEVPVRLKLANGQEVGASSTNLSEGGIALRTTVRLPKDAAAEVRFSLPASGTSLEVKGQVAWADGSGHAGIRFVEVPQSSQYQLDKWLTEHMQKEVPASMVGFHS